MNRRGAWYPMVGACCLAWAGAAWASGEVHDGERLSQWLLRQPPGGYALGVQWRVPQERAAQEALRRRVLAGLQDPTAPGYLPLAPEARSRYITLVQSLPATGRVAVGRPDAMWLRAQPAQDPVLRSDQTVLLPPRPHTVTVLLASGRYCRLPQVGGAQARSYLQACLGAEADAVDTVWLAQPDGRSQRYGVAHWNQQEQDELAPGAWLWAPTRDSAYSEAWSADFIRLLAAQGPAADEAALPGLTAQPAEASAAPRTPARDLDATANDWGGLGLLQTPTARFEQAGNFRLHLSGVHPYSRVNIMLQPFDWLEAGFRYTDLANQEYNSLTGTVTGQTLKDKSVDLKLRLRRESAYLPQLALGMVDIGGTGLFSGEYLVASKRSGSLDWSLGLGWGYLGARGDVNNPLGWFNPNLRARAARTDQYGGTANTNAMFTGPAAFFGGVQWRPGRAPLLLKLEYEGNDYRQREPYGAVLEARTPFNAGLVYRVNAGLDLTVGYERGRQWMLGLTLHENLARMATPKLLDPSPPPVMPNAPPAAPTAWQGTAQAIEQQTLWSVLGIDPQGDALRVRVASEGGLYVQDRLQRLVAVLHRDAPARYRRFVVVFVERGAAVHAEEFDRAAWVAAHLQPVPAGLAPVVQRSFAPSQGMAAGPAPQAAATEPSISPARSRFGIAPYIDTTFGGVDAFVLYQVGLAAQGEYRFTSSTWLGGVAIARMADNFKLISYVPPVQELQLPRVRSYAREYAHTSNLNLGNLQLTSVHQVNDNQFVSVYGGLLESMFAGIGAEWLYRPWGSPLAWGVDINRVQQRDFAQNFALRDYQVTTGHATAYWDTGWKNVLAKVSVGQYLAGDRGATLDVSRRFDNGVVMGVYATKTNVSAEQFGEGSFDKAVYVRIPLDAMLLRSTNVTASFSWHPLARDGGARLDRAYPLYDLTRLRDPVAQRYAPAGSAPAQTADRIFD